jgi:hypothetical protein
MGQTGVWLPRQRARGLLTEQVGEDVVVLDQSVHQVHCLTGTAAAVWNLCDGSRGTERIAEIAGVGRADADAALDTLRELDLIEPPREQPSEQTPRVTRRAIARRALQAGAGGLVLSAALPAVAGAASTKIPNGGAAPHCTAPLLGLGPVADAECLSGFCYLAVLLFPVCVPSNCAGLKIPCGPTAPCCGALGCVLGLCAVL